MWLDLPRRVWLPRLLGRTARRILTREELWNGNRETLRNFLLGRDSLLRFALRTYEPRRRLYASELGQFNVVRLCSPAEVDRWLEDYSSSAISEAARAAPPPSTGR